MTTTDVIDQASEIGDQTPEVRRITYQGRTWLLDPAVMDDYELLDAISRVDSGDMVALPTMLRRLLGDQYRDAMDAMRSAPGARIHLEEAAEWVKGFLVAVGTPNS